MGCSKTDNRQSFLRIENMNIQELIHEQLLEYSQQLKELEKEIIRKYKAGENYSADVTKASGLKMLKEECVRMMAQKANRWVRR